MKEIAVLFNSKQEEIDELEQALKENYALIIGKEYTNNDGKLTRPIRIVKMHD